MPHPAAADTNMAERPVDAAVVAVDSTSPVADPTTPVADPIATDHSKRSTLFRRDYLRIVVRRFVRRRWRRGGCAAAIPSVAPDHGTGGMDDASVAALEKVAASAIASMACGDINDHPNDTIPVLPIEAPIIEHIELAARLVWNIEELRPMQRAAFNKMFSNAKITASSSIRV